MPRFIINTNQQANGDFEVHNATIGCSYMPLNSSQKDLGMHHDCYGAVAYAKYQWPNAKINGCYWCCNACHTS